MLVPLAAVAALTAAACRITRADRSLERSSVYIQVEALGADDKPSSVTGSGICLLPAGLVVTNQHIVRRANSVRVVFHAATPEEYQCAADVVGVHPDRDLALLQCRSDRPLNSVPLGSTQGLQRTDPVHCVGFPFGALLADGNRNPSVSVVAGSIAALRSDGQGRLTSIDIGAPVAGGNSGSAVLDQEGQLIGILTQRYEGFGRALPVEYVKELLGEAALEVRFDPQVAPEDGGQVAVTVTPRGPVTKLARGGGSLAGVHHQSVRMKPDGRALTAMLRVPPRADGQQQLPVIVRATTPDGFELRRVVGLDRVEKPQIALRGVIHAITLDHRKANGWRWDADAPDPFCNVYVNDLLVKQTVAERNQDRFLNETDFDCQAGDRIRITVQAIPLRPD